MARKSIVDRSPLVHGLSLGGTYAEVIGFDREGSIVRTLEDRTPIYLQHNVRSRGIVWDIITEKDSRFLTEGDMSRLNRAIETSSAEAVVVAIGTFRMRKAALQLKQNSSVKGKTVVFFGAFFPLWTNLAQQGTGPPDAPFNLGAAIMAAQTLPPGIYVVMHGRAHSPERIRKHTKDGVFDILTEHEVDDLSDDEPWYVPPEANDEVIRGLQAKVDRQDLMLELQHLSQQQLTVIVQQLLLRQLQSSGQDPVQLVLGLTNGSAAFPPASLSRLPGQE